jgi:YfiH family protein
LIFNKRNGVSFLQFPHLRDMPGIRHAVFTRHDGYSRKPYDSLNTSFGVGDDSENVRRNRLAIQDGLDADTLVYARQVHGTDILVVTCKDDFRLLTESGRPPVVDALVTNVRNHFLVVQVADCQPVFLYDTARQVAANIHSGWRGSVSNIIGRTIRTMQKEFGTAAGDIVAGVGPSLGPCCAEFINYRREIPQDLWQYKNGDHHFDFWAISRDQLAAAGVPQQNIFLSDMCTRCNTDRFFSYREEKITGRFAAVIGLQ